MSRTKITTKTSQTLCLNLCTEFYVSHYQRQHKKPIYYETKEKGKLSTGKAITKKVVFL